jgi:hypothetical protein
MGVFDPRQGQVLPSPIRQYYRGKAIRQDQKDKEQMAELRGLQIESVKDELANAPDERERAKKLAEANMARILAATEDTMRQGDIREMQLSANLWTPALEKYTKNKDSASALADLNTDFFEAIFPNLREKDQKKYLEMIGGDREISHDDAMTVGASIAGFQKKMEDPDLKIDNFVKADGSPAGSYIVGSEGWVGAANNPNIYKDSGSPSADSGPALTEVQKIAGDLLARGAISQETYDQYLMDALEKKTQPEGGLDAKGIEIARYEEFLDLDTATATKLAYGKLKVSQNPNTGRVELLDEASGTAVELPVENLHKAFTPKPEKGRTLWAMSDWSTGPGSAATAAYNIPAAIVGLPVNTKVTQARQTLRTTSQSMVRALSINPRFPVGEQNRIREEIALLPSLLDDPVLMRNRMISLSYDLGVRMEQELSVANDTSVGDKLRRESQARATEIKNFLPIMGVPPKIKDDADFDKLQSGDQFIDPNGEIRVKP